MLTIFKLLSFVPKKLKSEYVQFENEILDPIYKISSLRFDHLINKIVKKKITTRLRKVGTGQLSSGQLSLQSELASWLDELY